MILDENSVSHSDFSQAMQRGHAFAAELVSESCPPSRSKGSLQEETAASSMVDWVYATAGFTSTERLEQERLQNVEREFVDRIIEEYERAVQKGLVPARALASMLEWASRECPRLIP